MTHDSVSEALHKASRELRNEWVVVLKSRASNLMALV